MKLITDFKLVESIRHIELFLFLFFIFMYCTNLLFLKFFFHLQVKVFGNI